MIKLDEVYLLVKQDQGIWYSPPAPSPLECWHNAWKWETFLFEGMTQYDNYKLFQSRMQKGGWRAKKVTISL